MYFHPLNFIRFLLALGVLLFHYGMNYFPFNVPVLKTLILNSSFRVSFFFFISGFVMSLVYGSKPVAFSYFIKKRLTRILPLYWLAFIATLLAVVLLLGAGPKGLVIILHFLGLQSWYPGYVLDLNFTTWSISVEFFFYLCFPFLVKWVNRWPAAKLLAIAAIVWILQSIQHIVFVNFLSDGSKRMEEFINAFPPWHLGTFFLGIVTARLISLEKPKVFFTSYSVFIITLVLAVVACIIYLPNPVLKYIHNGLLAPLFALFILALYYNDGVTGRLLSSKYLSRLGDLSYGLFIFQYPVWVVFSATTSGTWRETTRFFWIYLLSVLAVSWIMNRYIEKPLMVSLRQRVFKAPVSGGIE